MIDVMKLLIGQEAGQIEALIEGATPGEGKARPPEGGENEHFSMDCSMLLDGEGWGAFANGYALLQIGILVGISWALQQVFPASNGWVGYFILLFALDVYAEIYLAKNGRRTWF